MTSTDNNNQTNNGDQEKALETVYDLFEKFIKETIIDGKSFFDDTISVKGVIDDLVDAYIVNGLSNAQYKTKREEEHYKELEGFGLFHNKSLLQIKTLYKKGETYERKALEHLFASMLWLRYLPVGDVKTENKKKIIQKWVNDSSDKIYFPEKTLALYGMAQQQIDADMVHLIALFHFLFSTNFSDHFLKKNGSYVYFNILTNSNLENITKKKFVPKH